MQAARAAGCAGRPVSLRRIGAGRLGDGWIPSLPYVPPDRVPEAQRRIDDAAAAAERNPAQIRRIYNVMGLITEGQAVRELLQGSVDHWVETLTMFVTELGFDTFIFWPAAGEADQLDRFAREVMPGVRAEVARARGTNADVRRGEKS